MKNIFYSSMGLLVGVVIVFGFLAFEKSDFQASDLGRSGRTQGTAIPGRTIDALLLDATTTNATSSPLDILGASKIQFFFSRGGPDTTGTSTFSVQVTGEDWDDDQRSVGLNASFMTYPLLFNSAVQANTFLYTTTTSISDVSTTTYAMEMRNQVFRAVRCIVVDNPDADIAAQTSTSSCRALVTY